MDLADHGGTGRSAGKLCTPCIVQLKAARGVCNDIIILARCQSLIISDIRPFDPAVEQYLKSLADSENFSQGASDLRYRPGHGFEARLLPSRLIACCPGKGRARRTLRSSSGPSCFVSKLDHLCLYQAHRPRAPPPPLAVFVCFSEAGSV